MVTGSRGWRSIALLLSLGLMLVACAPPRDAGTGGTEQGTRPNSSAPKTLRIATLREPVKGLAPPGGTQFGDMQSVAYLFHTGLTVFDEQGSLRPAIAEKVPTIADGDWVVHPNGEMELTWRLRPDVRWHDGTPLTAEDFVFGTQIVQDPEVPLFRGIGIRYLTEVQAPDARTFVTRWKQPFFEANVSGPMEIPAVPRRIVGDLFDRRDMQALMNSPYWTSEWVGLGPYRLANWALGSYAEAVAFDDYFMGRPKIDRLIIRYFTDLNTMVANLIAGEVDLIPAGTIKLEEVMAIKQAWDPRRGGTVVQSQVEVQNLRIQFRYPNAPWASDARVRRALAHLTDRQTLVDDLLYGTSTVADTMAKVDEPIYQQLVRRGLPTYPFDVAAGDRLMAEAGWNRTGDGFVNSRGERFGIEFRVVANSQYNVNQGLAITDQWKSVGLNPTLTIIAALDPDKEELKATANGVYWFPDKLEPRVMDSFTVSQTSNERSRWRGNNYGAYANPTYDEIYERYANTLDPARRQDLLVDVLKLAAEDVPFIPLHYTNAYATAYRSGIRGPGGIPPVQLVVTWNAHQWEMD